MVAKVRIRFSGQVLRLAAQGRRAEYGKFRPFVAMDERMASCLRTRPTEKNMAQFGILADSSQPLSPVCSQISMQPAHG